MGYTLTQTALFYPVCSIFAGPSFRHFFLLPYSVYSSFMPMVEGLSSHLAVQFLSHMILSSRNSLALYLQMACRILQALMLVFSNVCWIFFLASSSGEGDQGILFGLFKQNKSLTFWDALNTHSYKYLNKCLLSLKFLVMPLVESVALPYDFFASQMREF